MDDTFAVKNKPILTGVVGTNAELIAEVFKIYVPVGSVVADVTYGRGLTRIATG